MAVAACAALWLAAACGPANGNGGAPSRASSGATGAAPATAGATSASGTASGPGPVLTRIEHRPGAPVLTVTVTVVGPVAVQQGCVAPLVVELADASGVPLPARSPSAPTVRCNAISVTPVPAGESLSLSAELPTPDRPGTYTVRGSLRGGAPIPTATLRL